MEPLGHHSYKHTGVVLANVFHIYNFRLKVNSQEMDTFAFQKDDHKNKQTEVRSGVLIPCLISNLAKL